MGGGVPQGSVLGPTLWNILYDDLMKVDLPEGVTIICYADDLATVITAESKEELQMKGEVTLVKVKLWLTKHRLSMALKKTKAIILNRPRNITELVFELNHNKVVPDSVVKYRGVDLDRGLSFGRHTARDGKGQ